MKNSRLRRLLITLGIVLGLALSVLILSIIGQEGNLNKTTSGNALTNDTLSQVTLLDDKDCIIVNVYGYGKATYSLSLAVLDIYVRNPEPSMRIGETYDNVMRLGNRIVSILEKNNLKIETKSISIRPYYAYPNEKLTGYIVTYHIVATTSNMSAVVNVVPYLVNKMIIMRLGFSVNKSTVEKAYEMALSHAIENALDKLNIIARTLGMDKIVILNIKENFYPIVRPLYIASVKITQPVIYAPTGEVSAVVYVTARLCK